MCTAPGWLHLATVIDVYSRRVIGSALADHLRAQLVCDAVGRDDGCFGISSTRLPSTAASRGAASGLSDASHTNRPTTVRGDEPHIPVSRPRGEVQLRTRIRLVLPPGGDEQPGGDVGTIPNAATSCEAAAVLTALRWREVEA